VVGIAGPAGQTRVIYLGAFLLEDELTLRSVDVAGVRRSLVEAVPGLAIRQAVPDRDVLLTPDEPTGSARMSPFLVDGTAPGPDGPAAVLIGHTGVAGIVAARDVDLGNLAEADHLIASQFAQLRESVAASTRGLRASGRAHSRPTEALHHDGFLWWHRILISADDIRSLPANLTFGVPIRSALGEIGLVAQGFSVLRPHVADMADDLARGLFAATEEWIEVDQLDRRVGSWMPALSGGDKQLEQAEHDVAEAAATMLSHRAIFGERIRYLRNAARAALVAAREAWNIDEQMAQMDHYLDEVRQIVNEAGAARQARRDFERNEYLYAFTLLLVLQTLLAVFDFVTSGEQSIVSGARVFFGGVVVGIGVLVLIRVIVKSRHEHA
jgi:hypothetical protein